MSPPGVAYSEAREEVWHDGEDEIPDEPTEDSRSSEIDMEESEYSSEEAEYLIGANMRHSIMG